MICSIFPGEKPFRCLLPTCMKRFRYKGDLSKHIKRYHPGHTQSLTPVPLQDDEVTAIALNNKTQTAITQRPTSNIVTSTPVSMQLRTSKPSTVSSKKATATTIGATDNKFFLPLLPKHPVQQSELPGFSRPKIDNSTTIKVLTPTISLVNNTSTAAPLSNESVLDLLTQDKGNDFASSNLSRRTGLIQTIGQAGQKARIQIQQPNTAISNNPNVSKVSFVVTRPTQGYVQSSKIGSQNTVIMRQQSNPLPPSLTSQVSAVKQIISPTIVQTTSKLQEALLHGKPRTLSSLGRGGERVTLVTAAGITNNGPQTTRFAVPTSTIVRPRHQTVVHQNTLGTSNSSFSSNSELGIARSNNTVASEKPKTLTISISEVFACAQPLPLQEEARQHNKGKMTTMADLEPQAASLGPLNAVLQQKGITLASTSMPVTADQAQTPNTQIYRQIVNPVQQTNTVTIQQPSSIINTVATQPMVTANVIKQSIKGKSVPTVVQSDALKSSMPVRANPTKKAFVCDHAGCTKSFDKAALLRKHAKLHSKQCKFVCDVCHKGFESHSKKEDHYRKHTGVKPFLCEICGHSFRYKGMYYC